MKTRLFLLLTLLAITGFSQENVIKIGIPNMLYGDYSLSYERLLKDNNSITVKAGYFQPVSSFFIDPEGFTTDELFIKKVNGGFHTSAEYRFYFGNSRPFQGFYVAPYARYVQLKGIYNDSVSNTFFDVNATGNMIGVGAQLGAQWVIKDLITIDFSFFGAGIERYNVKLIYTTADHSDYDYNNIKGYIEEYLVDVNYLATKLKTEINNPSNLTARLPFLFPGFRMSLSVGIAF